MSIVVEDRWVKEPELRRYLSLSARTLARYRAAGLPHAGTYRLRRYHLPAVFAWLNERQWAAQSPPQARRRLQAAG